MSIAMLILAADTSSVVTRLKSIPSHTWMQLAIAVAALIVGVLVLRKVAKMNKVVLGVIVFLALTFIGFNWIYERNEPKWATPVVEKVATFFPSKGKLK